jgi:5-methylcytosine-specific restriction enzyme subunit McrC
VARQELRAKPKGKILFGEEIRRPPGGRLLKTCEFDDLDPDVLPNQIIHSALCLLQQHRGLDPKHRSELSEATKYWKTFARPPLSSRLFKRVQVHRNMRHYRFALKVCELIFQESIPDQETGAHRFRDFLRDEARMGDLFEQFVRNFFAREQSVYRVSRPEVKWNVEEGRSTPLGLKLLPSMNTDIVLERDGDRVIVDCKFYRDAFQRFHDTPKFISDHLYQLFAYLKNQSAVPGWEGVRGMLLYPAVGVPVDEQVAVNGHEIRVVSVNLGQEWQGVSGDLLRLLKVESPLAAMAAP